MKYYQNWKYISEIIKYVAILDESFFKVIYENIEKIISISNEKLISSIIKKCISLKTFT